MRFAFGTKRRVAQVASTPRVARWKLLGGEGNGRSFRAICGKPSCPGSLGELWNTATVARDPNDIIDEAVDDIEQLARLIDTNLEDLGDQADGLERRSCLHEARRRVDRQLDLVLSDEYWDEIATMTAIHRVLGPRWTMSPERPEYERGTPRWRRPMTIYYGHANTGYRISHGGKRNREGWRIGRRPFEGKVSFGPEYRRDPSTQNPTPPCRIFCPVCGGPNEVLPPAELGG